MPKLVFVVNNLAFFVSHRLPIALEAQRNGYHVSLYTGHAGSDLLNITAIKTIQNTNIEHTLLAFQTSGFNPFRELWGIAQIFWLFKKMNPDLVHCASPKGNLYGGLAARLANIPALVLAISGMGYAFTVNNNPSFSRFLIKKIYLHVARFAFGHKNKRVIVQNADDAHELITHLGISKSEIRLIPGSGVDLSKFNKSLPKKNIIIFPARMLIDKGLLEFIEAARSLYYQYDKTWRFVLAGTADYKNPSAINAENIKQWVDEGFIEWHGHVENMPALLGKASIACLPSYREGLPKSLLEAAAAGCAVVTTDSIGCREAIIEGKTGLLVPPRNSEALTHALAQLIDNPGARKAFGQAGRKLASERFDMRIINRDIMKIYQDLNAGLIIKKDDLR